MLRNSILPLLLLLAVPACSGEVIVPGEASSSAAGATSGSGTGGVGGSPSTSATTGGNGGSGGLEPSTSVGVGGAPTCGETHDTLSVSLGTWDNHFFSCGAETGVYELSAFVVENSSPGAFVLDSCPPNADCIPFLSKLSINAKGLYTLVPKGTYVTVRISVDATLGGCAQRVQIKNLPSWGGEPNPVQAGEQLWFLGVDGGEGAFDDSPLDVTTEALGCFPGAPANCGNPQEDFALRLRAKGNPGDPGLLLPMGVADSWNPALGGVPETLVARNLRSYTLGGCDAPLDLAYWVTHDYGLD